MKELNKQGSIDKTAWYDSACFSSHLDLFVSFLYAFTQLHFYVSVETSVKKFGKLHLLSRDERT